MSTPGTRQRTTALRAFWETSASGRLLPDTDVSRLTTEAAVALGRSRTFRIPAAWTPGAVGYAIGLVVRHCSTCPAHPSSCGHSQRWASSYMRYRTDARPLNPSRVPEWHHDHRSSSERPVFPPILPVSVAISAGHQSHPLRSFKAFDGTCVSCALGRRSRQCVSSRTLRVISRRRNETY